MPLPRVRVGGGGEGQEPALAFFKLNSNMGRRGHQLTFTAKTDGFINQPTPLATPTIGVGGGGG
jgi:hypothetical protein